MDNASNTDRPRCSYTGRLIRSVIVRRLVAGGMRLGEAMAAANLIVDADARAIAI